MIPQNAHNAGTKIRTHNLKPTTDTLSIALLRIKVVLPNMAPVVPRVWVWWSKCWSYRAFGPTTIHLQHEVFLLLALSLLTASSLQAVYRHNTATITHGDIYLWMMITAWLARPLLLRWICTRDTTTTRVPTLLGVASHWITSHVTAGQYFDRPEAHVTARSVSNNSNYNNIHNHHHHGHIGNLYGHGSGGGGEETRSSVFRTTPLVASLRYTWQLGLVWVWYPWVKFREAWVYASNTNDRRIFGEVSRAQDNNSNNNKKSNSLSSTVQSGTEQKKRDSGRSSSSSGSGSISSSGSIDFSSALSSWLSKATGLFHRWIKLLTMKGPPFPLCLVLLALCWCAHHLLFFDSTSGAIGSGSATGRGNHYSYQPIAMSKRVMYGDSGIEVEGAVGGTSSAHELHSYRVAPRTSPFGPSDARHEPPQWSRLLFFTCGGSLIASILIFGRIFLPIPDLVAGTSPLKAVRAEATNCGHGSSGGSGSGGGGGSGGGRSFKAKIQKENQDPPWLERNTSIAWSNRFRLFLVCCLNRIVENIIVCAVIPRTSFVCRRTGHCPPGPVLWELSSILYPSGISKAGQLDRTFEGVFQFITPDRGTAIVTALSVLIITSLLLLVQATTLDKSYLAIMGYISGEWTVVADHPLSSKNQSGSGSGSTSALGNHVSVPTQWDPKRRYKKGDLILHTFPGFGNQSVYVATSNSPEGRPFDLFLRAAHDLFRNELGHAGTSQIISAVSKAHLAFMGLLVLTIGWYLRRDYNSIALLMVLLANLIASYGMVYVGRMDYSELATIGEEVSRPLLRG